tara:strand:- start:1530 stop:2360 length:831 start_codon:yes stop_codon:yes gene_type:complete
MNEKDIINKIKLPTTNVYYEKDSADGYAYLGYSQAILNLDYNICYNKMMNSNLTLNADRRIPATNVKVYKDTLYVYTFWSCIEFLQVVNKKKEINNIMEHVDNIGQYESNGMMRYCTTEINYVVPNVTAIGALLYAFVGDFNKSNELIETLEKRQVDGNWKYGIIEGKKETILKREEDSIHLSMIVYSLRMVQLISKIDTSGMVDKALRKLYQKNKNTIQGGSIGWGIPMLYLATKGLDESLADRSLDELLKRGINSSNFRTRGLSAFCLTNKKLH